MKVRMTVTVTVDRAEWAAINGGTGTYAEIRDYLETELGALPMVVDAGGTVKVEARAVPQRRTGTLDPRAADRALTTRMLEQAAIERVAQQRT